MFLISNNNYNDEDDDDDHNSWHYSGSYHCKNYNTHTYMQLQH